MILTKTQPKNYYISGTYWLDDINTYGFDPLANFVSKIDLYIAIIILKYTLYPISMIQYDCIIEKNYTYMFGIFVSSIRIFLVVLWYICTFFCEYFPSRFTVFLLVFLYQKYIHFLVFLVFLLVFFLKDTKNLTKTLKNVDSIFVSFRDLWP